MISSSFLKRISKFLIIAVVVIQLSLGVTTPVKAATDFQHLITAKYTINEDNSAHVEYHFKTTNKLRNNYLKSYTFTLPFEPHDIVVENSPTQLKVKGLNEVNVLNTFELEVEFISPVYGEDKSFEWGFSFDLKNIVLDHGIQKALILPTFAQDESFVNYNISVTLPKKLGALSYVYGNAGVQENDISYFLNFVSIRNPATSITILIGNEIEYQFEVTDIDSEKKVALPVLNNKQKVLYSEFPQREIINDYTNHSNSFAIHPKETIKGIIKSSKAVDTKYEKTENNFKSTLYLDEQLKTLSLDNLSKKEKARSIYENILIRFGIDDYRVKKDLGIDLSDSKYSVNPAEINYAYQYLLHQSGIESRGTYGYVFPIQPFKTDEFITDQHIWTEFWDDNEWVTADPVWYISSRGTSYFDNNDFNHIKFGNYHEYSQINDFLNSDSNIKIIPATKASDAKEKEDLNINVVDQVYLNKELKVKIVNNSNYSVHLNEMDLNVDSKTVKSTKNFKDIDMMIHPNSTVYITFPLEYDLLLFNQRQSVKLDLKFYDLHAEIRNQTIDSKVTIQSNLSSYVSIMIFGGFILFSFVSLFVISLYKKSLK